jgi:hypothetical protein
MPYVTVKSGMTSPDGSEDKLAEYLCDWPGCSNIANHVLGRVREIGAAVVLCDEHSPATGVQPTSPRF